MCLGIPGQIIQVADSALQLAVVDVCGVKREVNISLICQDDPKSHVLSREPSLTNSTRLWSLTSPAAVRS